MSSPIEVEALIAAERSLSVFRSDMRRFKRILLCNDLPMISLPVTGYARLQKL